MGFFRRRLLLGAVVVLVVALVVADWGAKGYAEGAIETSVRRDVRGVGAVDASISSFPFVGRVLLQSEVSNIVLTVQDLVGHVVPVDELRLEVEGLRLDRASLLEGEDVRVTGIDRARVDLRVTRENVHEVLGVVADAAFALADGATLRVADGRVQLGAGISFPLPGSELLPCDPTATIERAVIHIVCTADHLPQVVLDALR